MKVAHNDGYSMRELTAILDVIDQTGSGSWRHGVSILTIDDRTLEIADVHCTDQDLVVSLKDGRKIAVPLWWYPRLHRARPEQRRRWELAGAGRGIHWPDVDEDLSLESILRGAKAPGAKPPAPV